MSTHLTIKNKNHPNPRTAAPMSKLKLSGGSSWLGICFVVRNKGSAASRG